MQNNSIAILDSGFGGLTVMRTIMDLLPNESIVYFGDTAHLPYGSKSKDTIIRYCIENSSLLLQQNIKMLVVACHTASCYALDILENVLPIPVIGVITSAMDEMASLPAESKVSIIGTQATIASGIYQEQLGKLYPKMQIDAVACPLFVPLVEEGFVHHPATWLIAKEYFARYEKESLDAVLLGCTHYPLLLELFQMMLPENVRFIDPSLACAKKVQSLLAQHKQAATQPTPSYRFLVSDSPEKFQTLGSMFLKSPISDVELVSNYMHNIITSV